MEEREDKRNKKRDKREQKLHIYSCKSSILFLDSHFQWQPSSLSLYITIFYPPQRQELVFRLFLSCLPHTSSPYSCRCYTFFIRLLTLRVVSIIHWFFCFLSSGYLGGYQSELSCGAGATRAVYNFVCLLCFFLYFWHIILSFFRSTLQNNHDVIRCNSSDTRYIIDELS